MISAINTKRPVRTSSFADKLLLIGPVNRRLPARTQAIRFLAEAMDGSWLSSWLIGPLQFRAFSRTCSESVPQTGFAH